MKIKLSLIAILQLSTSCCFSQSIGIGTTAPNNSAILDVQSNNRGALMPRMTTAQRKAIAAPEPGLLVYDTDKRTIFIFEGARWGQLIYKDDEQSVPISRTVTGGQAGDQLGASVAIDGDNAIIGSPYAKVNIIPLQGAAYIFSRVNGTWVQSAKLVASDGAPNDRFGCSVSISGNYAVVGSYQDNGPAGAQQGAAYVFVKNNGLWTQQAKLTASDAAIADHFGFAVAMKGDDIIVGAPDDDVGTNANQGSVYFFERTGTTWPQKIRLSSIDNGPNRHVGQSVDMDNAYAIAAAPGFNAAYVYFKSLPNWNVSAIIGPGSQGFGSSVSISAPYAAIGVPNTGLGSGTVYLYLKDNLGAWTGQSAVSAPVSNPTTNFGNSVSLSEDNLLVGAPGYTENGIRIGEAYLFSRFGSTWNLTRKIADPYPQPDAFFGTAVMIDGFNVICSAPFKNADKGEIYFLNIE